jgi:predicted transposase YbfD/YdcC
MACTHKHARLLAQEPIDVKENEIVAVKRLLLNMPSLEGAVVTGDAMNTQPEIARLVVQEKGGSTTFA